MSSLRDQKCSTGKCGTENAGPEIARLENRTWNTNINSTHVGWAAINIKDYTE